MGKYSMVELAVMYEKDCEGYCDECPLHQPVVEVPRDEPPMAKDYTICTLFDYIRENKPARRQCLAK